MIKIIDNFVPEQYQKELLSIFSSDSFLWTYQPCTYKTFNNTNPEQYQDVHFLGRQLSNENSAQKEYEFIAPFVYFFMEHSGLNLVKVLRSKANLILPSADKRRHPPHADCTSNKAYTLLYYINDSDGDTFIFDDKLNINKQITPKQGRAVIFPSNLLHCGSNPSNNIRLAINMIFIVE